MPMSQNLPPVLDINEIDTERRKLREQLSVVSKKVSALILENHPSYTAELSKVTQVQKMLSDVCLSCQKVRSNLHTAQSRVSTIGLQLLADHRKMRLMRRLLSSLRTVKTLHETNYRLEELLEEGDFPTAIRLCIEGQKAAVTYSHFSCIGELSYKLSSTLLAIEDQLDKSLASITMHFDPDRYVYLSTGYALLNRVSASATKLISNFQWTLENSARTVLIDHIPYTNSKITVDSMPFEQLCTRIPSTRLVSCLTELALVSTRILHNYHAILRYHIEENERLICGSQSDEVDMAILKKLTNSLHSVCETAIINISTLLSKHELVSFKFDTFLKLIDIVHRFEAFSKRCFTNRCQKLRSMMENHTRSYFQNYHRDRLDELKMFIESEAWTLCPVQKDFILFQLPEFHFLKHPIEYVEKGSESEDDDSTYKLLPIDASNPFDFSANPQMDMHTIFKERVDDRSFEDSDEEIEGVIERMPLRTKQRIFLPVNEMTPLLCNTALNLLRLFGGRKYFCATS